jgi:signal transduction histidine kinase
VVLDQLLDASQLDAGEIQAQRTAFEVRDVVSRTVDEFTPQARLSGHRLQVDLAPGLPRAVADPMLVNRVLRSLLSNALKYSPHGGDIWIAAAPLSAAEVELSVQDEGLGIPPEWLARLFARFQRVDLPDRASIRGTGLGLYIARQLVEVNGGRIWAESDGAGRGACFHFTLLAEPALRRAAGNAARTA